ncbi:MAG: DUF3277 family protein [Rhizonema sp. NSF051]|nr:DUF3277 family protein [Rhizonema sp. NSF051]
MSDILATYDPTQVIIVLDWEDAGGQPRSHIVTGVSENQIVMVERQDAWNESVGAYGNTTRIYNPVWDKANITIPLQQTSESNDILDNLFNRDIRAKNSDNLFSITVKDTSGRSLHYGHQAYVAVKPNAVYGNTMETREWVVRVNKLDDQLGGNSKVDASFVAEVTSLGGTVPTKWIE